MHRRLNWPEKGVYIYIYIYIYIYTVTSKGELHFLSSGQGQKVTQLQCQKSGFTI